MDHTQLCKEFKEKLGCDTVRIAETNSNYYMIAGYRKDTRDDPASQHYRNGEPYDFQYVDEKVVARGGNEAELRKDAEQFIKVSKMSQEAYFEYLTGIKTLSPWMRADMKKPMKNARFSLDVWDDEAYGRNQEIR